MQVHEGDQEQHRDRHDPPGCRLGRLRLRRAEAPDHDGGDHERRDLQAVERDFAFVVDADVEALTLINAAAGADKALVEEVRVFDEFIGGSLGEGKKSLAITVRLQPTEATLKDADIEAVSARIVEKVTTATGGTLRG